MAHQVSCEIGGRLLTLSTGHLARQANGSVVVHYGETVVLVTAVAQNKKKEGIDFLPLTVEYQEKFYSAGRIPGGFLKREGRPTTKATLSARLIDRPLRPSFPGDFGNDTQVIATVLSFDNKNDPAVAALIGASAALEISDIPFQGPIAAVRVGYVDGECVINPTPEEIQKGQFDFLVAGNRDAILMVEGAAKEISEELVVKGLMFAHKSLQPILQAQEELKSKVGKSKMSYEAIEEDKALRERVEKEGLKLVQEAYEMSAKHERYAKLSEVKEVLVKKMTEGLQEKEVDATKASISHAFENLKYDYLRQTILKGKRIGGRKLNEIRDITCEVGVLPRTHGSSLFTRGETQALVTVTLGGSDDEQRVDSIEGESSERFMLHYNFPPFSVGEVGFMRGPGRREIGHGNLAQRALEAVLPSDKECPYTIRIVSEILESNGSSSMATVCGGSLALMDSGIAIKSPVAGIAMGLIKEGTSVAILSDILGDEDHLGDMDFKVAGTVQGITAVQMDLKIGGISEKILKEALEQAHQGRLFILEKMRQIIEEPRVELSKYAPRITVVYVKPEKIGEIIGKGGSTIKKIIEETGAKIDITDDGKVCIISSDPKASEDAKNRIEKLTEEVEVGKIYKGRVAKVVDFGAFVDILPRVSGLLHISELDHRRVRQVTDIVKVGDEIEVKVLAINPDGKISLSRKALLERPLEGA